MGTFLRAENYVLKKSDSTFVIVIFGIIYFTSQIIIGSILHNIGAINALSLQTTLASDKFKAIASGWIASGQIADYYRHFYFDSFHPIWYSIFLSLLIARTFKINNVSPECNFIILTPFAAAICDFFENMMHLYFLADLDRATPTLVAISGLATNTKWLLAALGVGTVTVQVIVWLVRKRR
jgi:hypothetical protein